MSIHESILVFSKNILYVDHMKRINTRKNTIISKALYLIIEYATNADKIKLGMNPNG